MAILSSIGLLSSWDIAFQAYASSDVPGRAMVSALVFQSVGNGFESSVGRPEL